MTPVRLEPVGPRSAGLLFKENWELLFGLNIRARVPRLLVYMYLSNVFSASGRYFNKNKRTSYLGQ